MCLWWKTDNLLKFHQYWIFPLFHFDSHIFNKWSALLISLLWSHMLLLPSLLLVCCICNNIIMCGPQMIHLSYVYLIWLLKLNHVITSGCLNDSRMLYNLDWVLQMKWCDLIGSLIGYSNSGKCTCLCHI